MQSISPFDREGQHKRKSDLILAIAAELFNVKGTRATTLVDITARLNLTKTSLYYYVKTKEDLVYKCYVQTIDQLLALAKEAARAPCGRDRMLGYARLYIEYWGDVILGNKPHIAVLAEIPILKGKHFEDIQARLKKLRMIHVGFIEDGIADGTIACSSPELTALCFNSMVQWSVIWLEKFGPDKICYVHDKIAKIITEGLTADRSHLTTRTERIGSDTEEKIGFDHEKQRQQKLDAFMKMGTRYFNGKGYKGTSIDEISRALNSTKGAFYYHIKNKEELLVKCFERTLTIIAAKQDGADNIGKTGLEKLKISAHTLYGIQNSEQGPLLRFTLLNAFEKQHRDDMVKRTQDVSDTFGRFVAAGQADKSINDVDTFIAEQLITGAINGASYVSDYIDSKADLERDSAQYFEILFKGLNP